MQDTVMDRVTDGSQDNLDITSNGGPAVATGTYKSRFCYTRFLNSDVSNPLPCDAQVIHRESRPSVLLITMPNFLHPKQTSQDHTCAELAGGPLHALNILNVMKDPTPRRSRLNARNAQGASLDETSC